MPRDVFIYDTLRGEIVKLEPVKPGEIKMYVCGPTVYDLIHLGNARPMIVFDAFRRFLEYVGYRVIMVQNFTDIDDKIINKANKEGVPFEEIAQRYITEYWKDAQALRIRAANFHPRTSQFIDEIIEFIKDLERKGFSYKTQSGDVYFDISKFEKYGELSHRNLEEMIAGARVEANEEKKNPLDFALWKSSKPGEPFWESPWCKGRPGWHIECSAMSNTLLGETFDIHAGGNDLIFPHHENEKAQSEARYGKTFAKYWMHNGMVNMLGDKMSKSIGNIWTVRDALKNYLPDTIKTFFLSKHYRSPISVSKELLDAQEKSVQRVYQSLENVEKYFNGKVPYIPKTQWMKDKIEIFVKELSNDFNTPKAVSMIFELSSEMNKALFEKDETHMKECYFLIKNEFGPVLGIFDGERQKKIEKSIEDLLKILIEIRSILRKEKRFDLSDKIRDDLKKIGIILKDTPDGTEFEIK